MKEVLLGRTGLRVSTLCFGSLALSPLQNDAPLAARAEVLAYALSRGIRFVDTAQFYENYDLLREALRLCPRDDVVIATKTYAYDRAGAEQAVEQARRALGRDVIELFLLHEQESEHTLRGHAEALDVLRDYKARGVIRAVGLSTHTVGAVRAAVAAGLDVVHPLLNRTGLGICGGTREDMEAAVREAELAGLGVYIMKALGGGHLHASAARSLDYARGFGHALALGMRSSAEVDADLAYWETGSFPADWQPSAHERRLWVGDWCSGCGRCAEACSAGALTVTEGRAQWDAARCVLCGYCGGHCPELCLKIV